MLGRSNFTRSRNSSKSYKSTSHSYHLTQRASETRLSSHTIIPQPVTHLDSPSSSADFLRNNQSSLHNLHKILREEESIIQSHRQWCGRVSERIHANFQLAKSKIINTLNEQENRFRANIEKEYITFMRMLSQIKEGIRSFYNQKMEIEKMISVEKHVVLKQRKLDRIQDYYGNQFRENKTLLNQMQRQNEERQDFKSVNQFYSENKMRLETLNRQAIVITSFGSRLSDQQEENSRGLENFLRDMQSSLKKLNYNAE